MTQRILSLFLAFTIGIATGVVISASSVQLHDVEAESMNEPVSVISTPVISGPVFVDAPELIGRYDSLTLSEEDRNRFCAERPERGHHPIDLQEERGAGMAVGVPLEGFPPLVDLI